MTAAPFAVDGGLDQRGLLRVVEGLHDPLRQQDDGEDDGERAAGCRARSGSGPPRSCPGVPVVLREKPRMRAITTAMPGGRGDEVLHGEPHHLGDVLHGGLAAVGLPVGVGDEADGGVEGEVRPDGAYPRTARRGTRPGCAGADREAGSPPG